MAVRYEDGPHLLLSSDRRADAIVLEALIADQPDSDLVPKLVAGLLGHRTAGRWASTQENAFVLLALGRYFDTYESVTPDFTARLWLGEDFAGEQEFHGRSTDLRHLVVPMAALSTGAEPHDLLLAKEGPGRLYTDWACGTPQPTLRLSHSIAASRSPEPTRQSTSDPTSDGTTTGPGTFSRGAGQGQSGHDSTGSALPRRAR